MTFWIAPDWPAPPGVRAVSTLRSGGTSRGRYASLNLGDHVGDDVHAVRANRQQVAAELALPSEPIWLRQVHGIRVIDADASEDPRADGSFTEQPGRVCAVMTADCLPVLLCSVDGARVAAVHGGWRGLAGGILDVAIDKLGATRLMAWLGPAIGPEAFEVGPEVREAFVKRDAELSDTFRPVSDDKWRADIYAIARRQLLRLGVTECYGGEHCTHRDSARFFSYRRDGETGRMATLIWRD